MEVTGIQATSCGCDALRFVRVEVLRGAGRCYSYDRTGMQKTGPLSSVGRAPKCVQYRGSGVAAEQDGGELGSHRSKQNPLLGGLHRKRTGVCELGSPVSGRGE